MSCARHVLQMAMAGKSGKKPDVIVISDDEDSLDSCRSRPWRVGENNSVEKPVIVIDEDDNVAIDETKPHAINDIQTPSSGECQPSPYKNLKFSQQGLKRLKVKLFDIRSQNNSLKPSPVKVEIENDEQPTTNAPEIRVFKSQVRRNIHFLLLTNKSWVCCLEDGRENRNSWSLVAIRSVENNWRETRSVI